MEYNRRAMSVIESGPFISPSEAIARVTLPEPAIDLDTFRELMKFQYDFDDEFLDHSMSALLKGQYWKQMSQDYLLVVKNQLNPRYGQVGSILGLVMGEIAGMFGDTVIERFVEDELLLAKKQTISPQAGIEVQFLDDNWEKVEQSGQLVGYKAEGPNGRPRARFIVRSNLGLREVEDWGMFSSGNTRFVVKDLSLLTAKSNPS